MAALCLDPPITFSKLLYEVSMKRQTPAILQRVPKGNVEQICTTHEIDDNRATAVVI